MRNTIQGDKKKLYSFIHKPEDTQISVKGNVICIHGLLGAARNLSRMTQVLASQGYNAAAYDQRGHGHSPHNASKIYTIESLAQDVFNIMDEYAMDSAHLVGHSLGGRVSLNAASMHPDRIKSIVMLDVGVRIHPDALHELHRIIDPLPEVFVSKEAAISFLSKYLEPSLVSFLMSNLRVRESETVWSFDLIGIQNSLINSIDIDQMSLWKKLSCPILLARGEVSKHFYQSEFEKMLNENSHAQGVYISNAGHWLHVDNFKDTMNEVLKFLDMQKHG